MVPPDVFTSPEIARIRVVLPAPLLPMSATSSPTPTCNVTSFKARIAPYDALRWLISSMANYYRLIDFVGFDVCTKISLNHLRTATYCVWCAFRDLLAIIQHQNMLRNAHD